MFVGGLEGMGGGGGRKRVCAAMVRSVGVRAARGLWDCVGKNGGVQAERAEGLVHKERQERGNGE